MGTRVGLVGVEDPQGADLTIRVQAHDREGLVAHLDRSYPLANRAEFERSLGYETLPEVLREVVPG